MSKLTNKELAEILISSLSISKKADVVYKLIERFEVDADKVSTLFFSGQSFEESYEADLIQTIRINNMRAAKKTKNPEMDKALVSMAFNSLFDAIVLVELGRYSDVKDCLTKSLLPSNRYLDTVCGVYNALLDPSLIVNDNTEEENNFLSRIRDLGSIGTDNWFLTPVKRRLELMKEAAELGLVDELDQMVKHADSLKSNRLKPKWLDYLPNASDASDGSSLSDSNRKWLLSASGFDWTYQYSDSASEWRAAEAEFAKLEAEAEKLGITKLWEELKAYEQSFTLPEVGRARFKPSWYDELTGK